MEARAGYSGPSQEESWFSRDVMSTLASVFTDNITHVYLYETPIKALILSRATADPDSKTKPFL